MSDVEAGARVPAGGPAEWNPQISPWLGRHFPSGPVMLWPPYIDIIAGGLGMSFALWSIRRRQLGKPMHPDAKKADGWLLVFAAALVCIGVARWPG